MICECGGLRLTRVPEDSVVNLEFRVLTSTLHLPLAPYPRRSPSTSSCRSFTAFLGHCNACIPDQSLRIWLEHTAVESRRRQLHRLDSTRSWLRHHRDLSHTPNENTNNTYKYQRRIYLDSQSHYSHTNCSPSSQHKLPKESYKLQNR